MPLLFLNMLPEKSAMEKIGVIPQTPSHLGMIRNNATAKAVKAMVKIIFLFIRQIYNFLLYRSTIKTEIANAAQPKASGAHCVNLVCLAV